jgi:hypothetical protein
MYCVLVWCMRIEHEDRMHSFRTSSYDGGVKVHGKSKPLASLHAIPRERTVSLRAVNRAPAISFQRCSNALPPRLGTTKSNCDKRNISTHPVSPVASIIAVSLGIEIIHHFDLLFLLYLLLGSCVTSRARPARSWSNAGTTKMV